MLAVAKAGGITANLLAPVVIHRTSNRGVQAIRVDACYSHQHPVGEDICSVIRRRAGESFLIGDGIEVEVLEVRATQVKLGIAAPKNVAILRREVQITQQENQAASREMSAAELATLAGRLRG